MFLEYFFACLIGLCVGSFLNVVIHRVPKGMSLATPPSHCPNCGYRLKWTDNIPVLSYLFLGGKCKNCKSKISFRYTLVEILNALLWMGAVWCFWQQSIILAIVVCVACSVLICIAFIDIEHQLIFDRFNITLLVLAILFVVFDKTLPWYDHLIGLGVAIVFFVGVYFVAQWTFKREAMGFGDVKLGAIMGLLLGWQSFLLSILLATLSASIILMILKTTTKTEKNVEYPFAPFLVFGCLIALFFGAEIIGAYLSLISGI